MLIILIKTKSLGFTCMKSNQLKAYLIRRFYDCYLHINIPTQLLQLCFHKSSKLVYSTLHDLGNYVNKNYANKTLKLLQNLCNHPQAKVEYCSVKYLRQLFICVAIKSNFKNFLWNKFNWSVQNPCLLMIPCRRPLAISWAYFFSYWKNLLVKM